MKFNHELNDVQREAKLRVFIICSGLGHIKRGYESFFRDCFDALCDEPSLDMFLFKGNGENKGKEIALWNLPRQSRAAKWLGKMVGRSAYFAEQFTFFVSLLPHILTKKPNVIYLSDVSLGKHIRFLQKFSSYKVLFNNNGPVDPRFLHRWDHIQQVSPQYLKEALEAGFLPKRQTLLPSAVQISETLETCRGVEQDNLRKRLGLPQGRRIILSVGSISKSRKRMDYLIREIARLPEPRPFALLLGERASDTNEIVDLGKSLLSDEGFSARTVQKSEVSDYYKAADLFALASLDEGFGLVYVEAMSYGLPCLVHDYETSRFVLGETGIYGDLTQNGALAKLILALRREDFEREKTYARHAYAYEHFSWDRLKPKYIDLFMQCVRKTPATVTQ